MKIQVCTRCIMDTSASDIVFDSKGICNYCKEFDERQKNLKNKNLNINKLIQEIKIKGKKLKYDCIVGVSGGVDSSFSLIKACELGLRPLAVHLDNGWNSELAQHNISNLIRKYNVDLYTHVIDWKEYRNFQEAFLMSNVIDLELLMDNAMLSVNYKLANKYGIKYILSGTNTATEGFRIPPNWSWFKNDAKNIKKIGKKFKNQRIDTFPTFGTFDFIWFELIKKINWILFPDYFDYKKEKVINELIKKIDYKPYPYKHYESVFTRFYQGYILPKKFGVDKRKLHLSNLIISNQISRNEAQIIIQQPNYINYDEEKKDIKYFLKKLKWSQNQFDKYIITEEINHANYGSEKKLWEFLSSVYKKNTIFKKIFKSW